MPRLAALDALSARVAMRLQHALARHCRLPFPIGHFYSPITAPAELAAQRERLWPAQPQTPGIDYDDAGHERLLRDVLPALLADFDYPRTGDGDDRLDGYYTGNSQFSLLDGQVLFGLLRHWRPRRLVEVGSGYSTLLTLDVGRRFLDGGLQVTCIEPFPRPFLEQPTPGLTLRIEPVQRTPLPVFEELQAGDVLFIDSSHVLKTGSDLTHLATQVLPRLARGVKVHMHDIFLPDDYPPAWVLDENRAWNEQYLLQAMLAHSSRYRVLFGSQYACRRFAALAAQVFGLPENTRYAGGSFWFEVA